jgi:hypothetical protein
MTTPPAPKRKKKARKPPTINPHLPQGPGTITGGSHPVINPPGAVPQDDPPTPAPAHP